jgi:DNA-binding GntR family transcriptional regulator
MLSQIQNITLSERVFESIREGIFSGILKPGDSLREAHIASDLRVSQVPVREALMRLEHVGLVVRTVNKNTIVTKMSSREVRERTTLREILEQKAFIESASRLTAADFEALEEISQEITDTNEKKLYFESAQNDMRFHRYIWECSGNEMLYRTLDNVTVPLFAFISVVRKFGYRDSEDLHKSHTELLAAMKDGDVEYIKSAISSHVNSSYETFLQSGLADLQVLTQKAI